MSPNQAGPRRRRSWHAARELSMALVGGVLAYGLTGLSPWLPQNVQILAATGTVLLVAAGSVYGQYLRARCGNAMSLGDMRRAIRYLMVAAGAALVATFCVWLGLCLLWEDQIISGLGFMALSVPLASVTRSMVTRALPPRVARSGPEGGV